MSASNISYSLEIVGSSYMKALTSKLIIKLLISIFAVPTEAISSSTKIILE